MSILIQKINKKIRVLLKSIFILTFITLSFQNTAIANEDKDKIVALTNWATIAFPQLFFNGIIGPASGFGYRYTCFSNPSVNCIGIKDGTNILDVRLDGQIISIGPVANTIATMAASNNGILNLSGSSVNTKKIPAVFSPGKGEVNSTNGQINEVLWTIDAAPETCFLFVEINSTNPSTIVNITLTKVVAGSDIDTEQWTLQTSGNVAISGVEFDAASNTLKITDNIVLNKVMGGSDPLTVSIGGTLKF